MRRKKNEKLWNKHLRQSDMSIRPKKRIKYKDWTEIAVRFAHQLPVNNIPACSILFHLFLFNLFLRKKSERFNFIFRKFAQFAAKHFLCKSRTCPQNEQASVSCSLLNGSSSTSRIQIICCRGIMLASVGE